jgi:RNA polymerase sigma factor (sigma-70 family)
VRNRNETVTENMGLVYSVAGAYERQGRQCGLEFDDLVSYGSIGLIEAAERYDTARGTKFSTYATALIRGRVLDALRSNHRPATLPLDDVDEGFDPDTVINQVSMQEYDRQELDRRLVGIALPELLVSLPEMERQVLILHYNHGMSYEDIAKKRKVTRSWVQQIADRAIRRLRRKLDIVE